MAELAVYGFIPDIDIVYIDGLQEVFLNDDSKILGDYGFIVDLQTVLASPIPVTPPEPPPASYTLPIVRLNPIPDSVGDISLIPDEAGDGDIVFLPGDVSCDAGLNTAIYMSLFTDAPVEDDGYEVRGWWGDALDEYGVLGSKLWTLTREKMTSSISTLARDYCLEALQWVVTEGVGDTVDVNVSRSGVHSLSIEVKISKPPMKDEYYRYEFNWSAQKYTG